MGMLGAIPETLENEIGECVTARTASMPTFRTLGPPDLVQLIKNGKGKESSVYHFETGVDVSSSASIAARLNTLTFFLGESQLWFGRLPQWKITSGTYCTYNAFSKLDVRVHATIPGGVEATLVDSRGDEHPVSEHHWREAYMSAMIRALLYKDNDQYFVSTCRHEDPLSTPADADRFLSVFEQLFRSGPLVGASYAVQSPTLENNLMVDALFKMLEVTGEYDAAKLVLKRLAVHESAAKLLLVRVELLSNDEIAAVEDMVATVKASPRDAGMLALEAQFCLDKGDLDLALDCALRSTSAAPVEFFAWEVLTKVCIARDDFEQALLSLNTAPLQQTPSMDTHRLPLGKRVHSPLPSDGVIEDIWALDANNDADVADPALLRLPASGLKGSSLSAFNLLAGIFKRVGWAELMRLRGDVFLMETEAATESKVTAGGTVGSIGTADVALDTPLPDAAQPSDAPRSEDQEDVAGGELNLPARRKSDSTRNVKSKRLCERRLDSLFMVLYEDVRVYSAWQREQIHRESQQLPFIKTPLEWEVFGNVCQRLGHDEQALRAYQKSLDARFSHRVVAKLLAYYEAEKSSKALDMLVQLVAWNHRWYTEFSPSVDLELRKIVAREGLTRVRTQVEAAFSRTGVLPVMSSLFRKLELFGAAGSDM